MKYLLDRKREKKEDTNNVFIVGGSDVWDYEIAIPIVTNALEELHKAGLLIIIPDMKGYELLVRNICRELNIPHTVHSSISMPMDRRSSAYHRYLMISRLQKSNYEPILISDSQNDSSHFNWDNAKCGIISPFNQLQDQLKRSAPKIVRRRGGVVSAPEGWSGYGHSKPNSIVQEYSGFISEMEGHLNTARATLINDSFTSYRVRVPGEAYAQQPSINDIDPRTMGGEPDVSNQPF